MRVVNLSSRPFVNERPVVRLSIALWALGALLLALNIYSYSTYWFDSEEIRGEIAGTRHEIDRQERDLAGLTRKASAVDVQGLNDHAVFLNNLIRYRTFPWSRLFDDLEDVLPKGARLTSVQPQVEHQQDVETTHRTVPKPRTSRRRSSSRQEEPSLPPPVAAPERDNVQEIPMSLHGFAKSDEVILDFVDTLFEHPSFRGPDFRRESLSEKSREVSFEIFVIYLLERPEDGDGGTAAIAKSEEPSPDGGAEPAEAAEPEDGADTDIVRKTLTSGETRTDAVPEEFQAGVPRAGEDAAGSAGTTPDPRSRRTPKPAAVDARRKPAVVPPAVEHDRLFQSATAGTPAPPPPNRSGFPAVPGSSYEAPPEPSEPPPAPTTRSAFPAVPGSAFEPPEPLPPGRPGAVRPRLTPRPPPSSANEAESRTRPRFVEPNASGTATILPGGGS